MVTDRRVPTRFLLTRSLVSSSTVLECLEVSIWEAGWMCVMARWQEETRQGDVSQREKMAGDLYTSAVLFAFWYKPWVGSGTESVCACRTSQHNLLSPNSFVIITSVNHAPPFWGCYVARPPRPSEPQFSHAFPHSLVSPTHRNTLHQQGVLFLQTTSTASPPPSPCACPCRAFVLTPPNPIMRTGLLAMVQFWG